VAVLTTSAILLRAVDYGEADRVLTLFGRSTGSVGAIARGARKSQKRFAGMGLCSVGDVELRERGHAELLTLERFDHKHSFTGLGGDLLRMGHAAYAAELVAKLCAPRQAEPRVFDFLLGFLERLDGEGPSDSRLRAFELGLLERLGFAPALGACATCGRVDLSTGEAIDVRWVPDQGGVVCRGCASRGRPMRPVVRLALQNLAQTAMEDAAAVTLSPDVARGCRDAVHELVAGHLSAPLRSLEFLAKTTTADPAP
jgi:DNA repair protein RecO (recombination protein O)